LSADDPSLGGRFSNAVTSGATSAVAAAALDPALRGVGTAGRKGANSIQRLIGVDPEVLADAGALRSFANHAPEQAVPEMRARLDEQSKLDADPDRADDARSLRAGLSRPAGGALASGAAGG
jgi:hypothetical protein